MLPAHANNVELAIRYLQRSRSDDDFHTRLTTFCDLCHVSILYTYED